MTRPRTAFLLFRSIFNHSSEDFTAIQRRFIKEPQLADTTGIQIFFSPVAIARQTTEAQRKKNPTKMHRWENVAIPTTSWSLLTKKWKMTMSMSKSFPWSTCMIWFNFERVSDISGVTLEVLWVFAFSFSIRRLMTAFFIMPSATPTELLLRVPLVTVMRQFCTVFSKRFICSSCLFPTPSRKARSLVVVSPKRWMVKQVQNDPKIVKTSPRNVMVLIVISSEVVRWSKVYESIWAWLAARNTP